MSDYCCGHMDPGSHCRKLLRNQKHWCCFCFDFLGLPDSRDLTIHQVIVVFCYCCRIPNFITPAHPFSMAQHHGKAQRFVVLLRIVLGRPFWFSLHSSHRKDFDILHLETECKRCRLLVCLVLDSRWWVKIFLNALLNWPLVFNLFWIFSFPSAEILANFLILLSCALSLLTYKCISF